MQPTLGSMTVEGRDIIIIIIYLLIKSWYKQDRWTVGAQDRLGSIWAGHLMYNNIYITDTYEYLMTRSGCDWLASAATSCVIATWHLLLLAGDDLSWVPTGTTSVDEDDSGLIGRITNTKHDFVGITVSGIVCNAFHSHTIIVMQPVLTSHRQQDPQYIHCESKKTNDIFRSQLFQMLADFQNFFTVGFSKKFAIKHLSCFSTTPKLCSYTTW